MKQHFKEFTDNLAELFEPEKPREGNLGYRINGEYKIECKDKSKFYVLFKDGSFAEIPHKGNVSPVKNLPVFVDKDKFGKPFISGTNSKEIDAFINSGSGGGSSAPASYEVGPHTHARFSGMEFSIDSRLFLDLSVRVVSGLTFKINPGRYDWNGTMYWYGGGGESLADQLPASGKHRITIIGIDPSTTPETIVYGHGISYPVSQPLSVSEISTIEFIENEWIPLCVVKLSGDQAALPESAFTAIPPIYTGFRAAGVTSVGLSAPNIFTVTDSPITTSGTIALGLAAQNANKVWAGPQNGSDAAPTFRALVDDDIPDTITLTNITQITNRSHTNLQDIGTNTHSQIDTAISTFASSISAIQSDLTAHYSDTSTHGVTTIAGLDEVQIFTNKTIDGDNNTLQDIALSSLKTIIGDANKLITRDASGTVISSAHLFTDETNDRLGIGVAPSSPFHLNVTDLTAIKVGSSGTSTSTNIIRGNNNFSAFSDDADWNGTNWVARDTSASGMLLDTGQVKFFAQSSLTAGNTFTPLDRFVLKTDGNAYLGNPSDLLPVKFGINVVNPVSAIDVLSLTNNGAVARLREFSQNEAMIYLGNSTYTTDNGIHIGFSLTNDFVLQSPADMVFKPGGTTTRATMSSSLFTSHVAFQSDSNVTVRGNIFAGVSTDDTNKTTVFNLTQYDTSAESEGWVGLLGVSQLSTNVLAIGGGNGSYNAATRIQMYTAANISTRTGTLRFDLNNDTLSLTSGLTLDSNSVSSGTYTSLSVQGATLLGINTSSGNVDIQGFANGSTGQVIFVYKASSANSLIFRHNHASGTQKILTNSLADVTINNYGLVMLVWSGSFWFLRV